MYIPYIYTPYIYTLDIVDGIYEYHRYCTI